MGFLSTYDAIAADAAVVGDQNPLPTANSNG